MSHCLVPVRVREMKPEHGNMNRLDDVHMVALARRA